MPSKNPFYPALLKAGLTPNEAELYLFLLEHGRSNVQELLKHTKHKRGNLYHLLYGLRDKGLVRQLDESKKLHFELTDPANIRPLLDLQRQQVQENIREVEGILTDLSSTYTLTYNKPGVVMFEGKEAMQRILDDSLTSTGDILQYVDLETVMNLHPEMNKRYAEARARLHKKKRMILPDTELSRRYIASQNPKITEVRLISHPLPNFGTVMQIYNNKISYLTIKSESMIGVIIEDALITSMHRAFFEFTWSVAQSSQ